MRPVVFVAPFFAEATLRFLDAAVRVGGARVGLVSQDGLERLPGAQRARLAAHMRIEDGLDPGQIAGAVRMLARRIGGCERLIGTLEQLQVPLAQVREAFGIEGLGSEAARNFRDKARMKQVLRAAGVPCARHFLASDAASALAFAAEVGYPVVAKPPAGAGARNTMRVDDPAALGELLARLGPSATQPLLIEEYVVGDEHSFDAVSVHGRVVWHSLTHYTPGPLEVLRNPWIQWTVLLPREVDHPRYDDIRGVAVRALAALGQGTGLSHMEWFRRADGQVAISEVAARPPGAQFTTVISYAHDFDFYRAWARLVMFDAFEPPERRFAAGIAYLRGQGAGSVRAIHGLEAAQRELGPLVVETRLPRPGTPAADSYEGEGYVVLRHPRTEVVADGLARLVRLLRVELA